MKCRECGAELEEGEIYCRQCGARVAASCQDVQQPEAKAGGPVPPYRGNDASVIYQQTGATQPMPSLDEEVSPDPSLYSYTPPPSTASSAHMPPRPPQPRPPQQPQPSQFSNQATAQPAKRSKAPYIILAVIIVLLLILTCFVVGMSCSRQSGHRQNTSATSPVGNKNQSAEVPMDTSGPFWGVWVFTSVDKAAAEEYAKDLTNKGYTACVVATTNWNNLDKKKSYAVTVGTWPNESDAEAMVSSLKADGYKSAYSQYTGERAKGSQTKSTSTQKQSNNTVQLQVQTSTGGVISGSVHRDSHDYVIADSSSREYSTSELRSMHLSDAELCIAWNEPYARNGYVFKNSGLQAYFESCSWYTPNSGSGAPSAVGKVNVDHLQEIASESSSASRWMSLAVS